MHEATAPVSVKRTQGSASSLAALLLGCALIWSGCTAARYRRAADKEVYQIVEQAELQIFGQTNGLNIDTAYSARKPKEILPSELIEDRLQTNRRTLTIEDALNLAVHGSRRYQAEKERLYLTALSLTGDRYAFSPQFFAQTEASLESSRRRCNQGGKARKEAESPGMSKV